MLYTTHRLLERPTANLKPQPDSNLQDSTTGGYGEPLPMLLTDVHLIDIHALHKPPLAHAKHEIITRHLPFHHPPVLAKRPILEPIATLPQPVVRITELVPELDCNLVVSESEQLLAKAIVCLPLPFGSQEGYDLVAAFDEGGAVAPDAVLVVCFCNNFWVSRYEKWSC